MSNLEPLFNDIVGLDFRVKVIDIGANPIDTPAPYLPMLRRGQAEVVGFEPNPQALAILNERKGPLETYLPNAVGDGGRHILHLCRAPGMSSLLEPNLDVLNLFHDFSRWAAIVGTAALDTVRLDDVPETEGADFIKIDIQGGELLALKNAVNRLKDVVVIQTEVEFIEMYKSQPLFSEVELFLRSQGFIFHRFFPIEIRPLKPILVGGDAHKGISQHLSADAIFVRDFTKLQKFTDSKLLSSAAILHNCYGSADVSLRFLYEYDSRRGTQVAERYFKALQENGVTVFHPL